VIALAVALPATRSYFLDQRAIGGGTGHLLYEVLVRIPFGTALAEEVVFRGSLLGLFLQRHSRTTATAMTSVLFGFWHVVPTLDTLPMNPAGSLTDGDVFRTGWRSPGCPRNGRRGLGVRLAPVPLRERRRAGHRARVDQLVRAPGGTAGGPSARVGHHRIFTRNA
jgi:hypothetical protein